MVASIWLRLGGEQDEMLRALIASLAAKHGTMPFAPHLTVCTMADPAAGALDAAAEYVSRCRLLPLTVGKLGISTSTTVPFRAVVIDVANAPPLAAFRDELRRVTGANALVAPHISLLYTIDARGQQTAWAADQDRLRAIADEAAPGVAAREFVLDEPVVVAPDGDWTNIKSWTAIRQLGGRKWPRAS
jgi:hypothetical protein